MRPTPQETAVWSHLLEKSLMENFIFVQYIFHELRVCTSKTLLIE